MVVAGRQVPELLAAMLACVRLFSSVNTGVGCQLMLLSKLAAAVRALERLFTRVGSFVIGSLLVRHELLAAVAERARVAAVVQVSPFVGVADVSARKRLAAN